jgi:hypothetical protein
MAPNRAPDLLYPTYSTLTAGAGVSDSTDLTHDKAKLAADKNAEGPVGFGFRV